MADQTIQYHIYPQQTAISNFLPILRPHLPHSNPLYNRIKAPHNVPSRHCLFAATFPPSSSTIPEVYTMVFADRSRHQESHIWVFNSLITPNDPLTPNQEALLTAQLESLIYFLQEIKIPEAPGWPFLPMLRFGCVHEKLFSSFERIANLRDALPYKTHWNFWTIDTSHLATLTTTKQLPEGFKMQRVPEDQLDIVLSTSSIKRQPSTYLLLPSVGIINPEGKLVAWGYLGVDTSLSSLYVLPEYRGRGFASIVALKLLQNLAGGKFKDIGYDGESGWVSSDVHQGNHGSEAVMRSLGAKILCQVSYFWIDSAKF